MKREGSIKGNPTSRSRKDQKVFNSNLCECTEKTTTKAYTNVYAANKKLQRSLEKRCTDCGLRRVACGIKPSLSKAGPSDEDPDPSSWRGNRPIRRHQASLEQRTRGLRSELKSRVRDDVHDLEDGDLELYLPSRPRTRAQEVQTWDIFIGHAGTWIDYGGASASAWDEDRLKSPGVETIEAPTWDEDRPTLLSAETIEALAWD